MVLSYAVVLRGELFSKFFSSHVCIFCTILNNVLCECASPWFDQGQPDDATDVQSTDLFDFGEDVKFGVVFEAGFTEELVILFLPFSKFATSTGQEM